TYANNNPAIYVDPLGNEPERAPAITPVQASGDGSANTYSVFSNNQTVKLDGYITEYSITDEMARKQLQLDILRRELDSTQNLNASLELVDLHEKLVIQWATGNSAPEWVELPEEPRDMWKGIPLALVQQYLKKDEMKLQKQIATLSNDIFRGGRPPEIR